MTRKWYNPEEKESFDALAVRMEELEREIGERQCPLCRKVRSLRKCAILYYGNRLPIGWHCSCNNIFIPSFKVHRVIEGLDFKLQPFHTTIPIHKCYLEDCNRVMRFVKTFIFGVQTAIGWFCDCSNVFIPSSKINWVSERLLENGPK